MNEVENLSPDHTHPPNMTIGEIINNKIKDLRRRKGKKSTSSLEPSRLRIDDDSVPWVWALSVKISRQFHTTISSPPRLLLEKMSTATAAAAAPLPRNNPIEQHIDD